MCLGADWLDSLFLDLVTKFTANNLAVRSVGELLTEPGVVGAAHLRSDHSWSFVAVLNWYRSTHSTLAITVPRLHFPAIEVARLLAHHVVDHGLLVLAGLTVKLDALEVIEGVNSDVEGSVANPLLHYGAKL